MNPTPPTALPPGSPDRPPVWDRFGGKFFFFSLVFHAVLLAGAGLWVVREIVVREQRFEAPPADRPSVQAEVQHRVQLARRAGASGAASINAQRITANAPGAFTLPDLPPSVGGGLGDLGGAGLGTSFGLGSGAGAGLGGGLGGAGGAGTAGTASDLMRIFGGARIGRDAQKVVFALDVSDFTMTPAKGGFEAFGVMRAELSKLVTRLSPTTPFNVILYDGNNLNLFRPELTPATAAIKQEFVEWVGRYNRNSAERGARLNNWLPADPTKGLPIYGTHHRMFDAIRAGFEMGADHVFLIVGNFPWYGGTWESAEQEARERRRVGDTDEVRAARDQALRRIGDQLREINRQLQAKGQPAIIIPWIGQIEDEVNQAAFRRAGVEPPRLDRRGWTRTDGSLIWGPSAPVIEVDAIIAFLNDFRRSGGSRQRVSIALFLGPEDEQKNDQTRLQAFARRFGGSFRTFNLRDLQDIAGGR